MRRALIIVGSSVGIIVLIIVALTLYAVLNLNSLIASNRAYILARASDALSRPVEVDDIKASVGWGVMMDLSGVKVADDPAFSQLPFVQAGDLFVNVEFMPLLSRSLKVTSLVLKQPQVRIIRDSGGRLNVGTIGKKAGEKKPKGPAAEKPSGGGAGPEGAGPEGAGLGALTVKSLTIHDGKLFYEDKQAGGPPITINALNLDVNNLGVNSPFNIALTLAAFSDRKNLDISGKIGPLMHNGALETGVIPLDLIATVGPLQLAQVSALPQVAHALPAALSVSEPITLNAKLAGTVDATRFDADSDLSSSHVVYQGILDKAAGVPLKFNATGARENGRVTVRQLNLTLAAVQLKAANITFGGGRLAARLDSNNFDLGELAKVLVAAQKYRPGGAVEVHTNVSVTDKRPSVDGTVTLAKVNVAVPGAKTPPLSDLSGTIRMAGNTAIVGPMAFNLGSGHANLQANAQSLQPLKATYQFSVDTVKIGELVPSRQDLGEQLTQLAANGSLSRIGSVIDASTKLTSASGMVANVPYQGLALDGVYAGDRVTINSLKLNAFDGAVGASGIANLAGDRSFNLKFNANKIDVQQALEAQKAKAAKTVRGHLTGTVQVAGAGANFDQIKPTLRGNGAANLDNGKLVGVNVVGQALSKVNNIPSIGSLVPASVVANHPALFNSDDTDIQEAKLTFVLQGPRITTHDLAAGAADYSILGDGWFDMDKNIDLRARIIMSPSFSRELVAAKQNVAYIENQDNRLEIPLRITGQLPKPAVVPDVGVLAQRAATHAVQNKIGSLFGKKGGLLGGAFGRGNPNGGGSNPQPTPSNPLDQLKGLFH
jgi:AsmA protein